MCLQSSAAFQSRPALSPATVYLLNSLEMRGDHVVAPKARSVSQLSPKHHISSPLCSHQLSPQVSASDAAHEPGAPAGVGCVTPQGHWEQGWWQLQADQLQPTAGASGPQNRQAVEFSLLPYAHPQQPLVHSAGAYMVQLRLFSLFNCCYSLTNPSGT